MSALVQRAFINAAGDFAGTARAAFSQIVKAALAPEPKPAADRIVGRLFKCMISMQEGSRT